MAASFPMANLSVRARAQNGVPLPDQDYRARCYNGISRLPADCTPAFTLGEAEWYDLSLPWFRNFENTAMDSGDEIRVFGWGTSTDQTVLPMRSRRSTGLIGSKVLSSLANFYSITFGPIGTGARDAKVLHGLTESITSHVEKWPVVDLRPMDRDSESFDHLVRAFRARGWIVQPYFCFGNWYLPSSGLRFSDYFKTLPPAMQNTIRRRTKKLEKAGQSRIEMVCSSADLENAIQAYEKVYLSSWKRPEPYPRFMPGLIRTCAQHGWLRLGIAYLKEEPIGAQMWIVNHGRATIYKLGHVQQAEEYSVGSILTAKLLEYVLDVDKVQEIDFGSGDDGYKKTWLPLRRERWGILAMNPRSLTGCLMAAKHIGGHSIKKAWTHVRGVSHPRSSESSGAPS